MDKKQRRQMLKEKQLRNTLFAAVATLKVNEYLTDKEEERIIETIIATSKMNETIIKYGGTC